MKNLVNRSIWLLLVLSLSLNACTSSTPTARPTIVPTITLIHTSKPPVIATSAVIPTSTPSKTPTTTPTAAFTPVATSTSTKMTVTAKPSMTAQPTQSSQPPSPGNAASLAPGSPLNIAVKQTFNNAQSLLGELNNVLAGIAGRCDVAIGIYDAIASAPTYGVSSQSADTQTAYSLYRQAVDSIDSTASKVRRVCQGGGVIDKLDIQVAQKSVGDAFGPLGHAIDLLPPVTTTIAHRTPNPSATPIPQKIALSDLLLKTMEQMHGVGGLLDGAQLNLDSGFCGQFVPQYQAIITKVILDKADKPAAWVAQYGAYEASIAYFQNKLYRALEVCNAGGGTIGKDEFSDMRRNVDVAAVAVARAYDELKKAKVMGQ